MSIRFFFRKPEFPVLILKENEMFGSSSARSLSYIINTHDFSGKEYYYLIDSASEGWAFYPKYDLITPLVTKKHWTKKEIVKLFNGSNTIKERNIAPLKDTILNRRFSQIVEFIVDSLNTS